MKLPREGGSTCLFVLRQRGWRRWAVSKPSRVVSKWCACLCLFRQKVPIFRLSTKWIMAPRSQVKPPVVWVVRNAVPLGWGEDFSSLAHWLILRAQVKHSISRFLLIPWVWDQRKTTVHHSSLSFLRGSLRGYLTRLFIKNYCKAKDENLNLHGHWMDFSSEFLHILYLFGIIHYRAKLTAKVVSIPASDPEATLWITSFM